MHFVEEIPRLKRFMLVSGSGRLYCHALEVTYTSRVFHGDQPRIIIHDMASTNSTVGCDALVLFFILPALGLFYLQSPYARARHGSILTVAKMQYQPM